MKNVVCKRDYGEIIRYLFIGGMTTVISLLIYYVLTSTILDATIPIELQIANIIQWIGAVTFAYFTNKYFVFKDKSKSKKGIVKFYSSRIITLLIEMLLMYIFVTKLLFNDKIIKIIVQVIVIVGNYILSKFFVFNKKDEEKECQKKNSIIKRLHLKPLASFQWAYLAFLLPFFHIIKFTYDNDFWFTINQGRYVLEHTFPTFAINSIHNIDMIYQSWGAGTIYYLIYHHLGMYGIIFLLITVCTLTSYFFYKLCYTISNNKRLSLYITILVLILYACFIRTRPHIFTVLNLTIMLYLLESYIKTNKNKYLYWLPLISLLQINIHGIYFAILLVIMIPFLINSFKFNFLNIKSVGYRKKPLIIIFICMILTGFINPYGYKTIIYGFISYDSAGLLNNSIIELLALNFHKLLDKLYIIVIIVTFILYFRKKELPIRYYLLLFGTSFLAFDAIKSYYLFAICSLYPFAYIYQEKVQKFEKYKYSKTYHVFHCSLALIIAVASILLVQKPEEPEISKYADFLDKQIENKEEYKIYSSFMDGSYLEYRGYYCYIDPRAEIFLESNNHKENIFKEYVDLGSLKIDYREFLDKYEFDYMLIKKDDFLYYAMSKFDLHGYKIVLKDDDYMLLEKE